MSAVVSVDGIAEELPQQCFTVEGNERIEIALADHRLGRRHQHQYECHADGKAVPPRWQTYFISETLIS